MALVMLAIGGLLALFGVYAMATGFPVIEIERGWSMVITGAVLLSGGLIIAALGIVVRTLNALRAGLAAATPAVSSLQERGMVLPSIAVSPAAAPPAAPEQVPAFAVAAPVAAAALAVGAGYAARHEAEPTGSEAHEMPAVHHEPEPEPAAEDRTVHEPVEHAAAEPVVHAEPEHAATDPLSHDWLEKEFAAFDLDAPQHAPAPHEPGRLEPEPHEPEPHAPAPAMHEADALPSAAHEPALAEPLPPEPPLAPSPEAAHDPEAEAPATAPESPPSNLTVIGRYDSDGTSYVMYSDGSIEAQSESGVFRFGSMAELKAFIEG